MKKKFKVLALLSSFVVMQAHAEITLNGFASIVGGKAIGSTLESDDVNNTNGYDNDIDFNKDSFIALQASSDLGNGLSVTAQIIARGENDWDPNFEWAYVSYDATDSLRVLAGKQRIPFYMYSDFLDVSYSYPWIEPPSGVYNVLYDTFDGLGAIYNFQTGDADHTIHGVYGSNKESQTTAVNGTVETYKPDFTNLFGASYVYSLDWFTFRTGYFESDLNIPLANEGFNNAIAGWENVGRSDIADNIRVKDDKGKFFEIGFQVDYNDYMIIAEYTDLQLEGVYFADEESYYLLVGKRVNEYLFHVTYGADKENMKENFLFGDLSIAQAVAPELVAGTNALVAGQVAESKYYTLGLRWDFHDSAALKFEYTDYSDDINNVADSQLFRVALVTVF